MWSAACSQAERNRVFAWWRDHSSTQRLVNDRYQAHRAAIEIEIKKLVPDARGFSHFDYGKDVPGGMTSRFFSPKIGPDEQYYFVYTAGDRAQLFTDEGDFLRYCLRIVADESSLKRVLARATLLEYVTGLIGVTMVLAFVVLLVRNNGEVNKTLLAFIGAIVTFYFGRVTAAKGVA